MAKPWAAATVYAVGTIVVPTTLGLYAYICKTPGTSGNSQPSPWSTTKGGITTETTGTGVQWVTIGDGLGNIQIADATRTIAFVGPHNLLADLSVGKPNLQLNKQGGTKTGPYGYDIWNSEIVLQIHGLLRGPTADAEVNSLITMFSTILEKNVITVTLTGKWAAKYGSSITMMPQGSNGLRVKPELMFVDWCNVEVQLIKVQN